MMAVQNNGQRAAQQAEAQATAEGRCQDAMRSYPTPPGSSRPTDSALRAIYRGRGC